MAQFKVRLRFTEAGIVDLAGDTWNHSPNVSPLNLGGAGVFGGRSVYLYGDSRGAYAIYGTKPVEVSGDFTISFWAKQTEVNNEYGGLVKIWPVGANNWNQIYINRAADAPNYTLTVHIGASDQAVASTPFSPVDGKWHHYAVTRRKGLIRCFIDGKVGNETCVNNGAFHLGNGNNADSMMIGYWKSGEISTAYRGCLDDFCVLEGRALWTKDFVPPASYLEPSCLLYAAANGIYGMKSDNSKCTAKEAQE